MKIGQSVINFAVYENGDEYLGISKVSLPDVSFLTQSISGAGIAGNVDAVIKGHIDTMTLGLTFRTTNPAAMSLCEPRIHDIDIRPPQQVEDTVNATLDTQTIKHVMRIIPKTDKGGSIAPASPTDGSGEYAVRYWKTYIDGECVREIDPLNNIFVVNGVDYLEDLRTALGK